MDSLLQPSKSCSRRRQSAHSPHLQHPRYCRFLILIPSDSSDPSDTQHASRPRFRSPPHLTLLTHLTTCPPFTFHVSRFTPPHPSLNQNSKIKIQKSLA